MRLNKIPFIAAAATLLMLAGTAAASAAPAYASATVNVRAGAGTGYPVVGVLRPGERVDIEYCRGAWCAIARRGADGWVNANYLNSGRGYDRGRHYDRYDRYDGGNFYINPRPRFHHRPYYRNRACIGSPNASFCITN